MERRRGVERRIIMMGVRMFGHAHVESETERYRERERET